MISKIRTSLLFFFRARIPYLCMNIIKAFEVAKKRMVAKNWDRVYVLVDVHDTIFKACYEKEERFEYFPMAKETLQLLTQREEFCLILWSSAYHIDIFKYKKKMREDGIMFRYYNENPEVKDTDLAYFGEKLYFNIGLDDKFGFEAETDWREIYDYLQGT